MHLYFEMGVIVTSNHNQDKRDYVKVMKLIIHRVTSHNDEE